MMRSPNQPDDTSPLDEAAVERLVRGHRAPGGASGDEHALSKLLAAASAPPSARELSGEARAVAAFAASRLATTGPRHARQEVGRHWPAMRLRVSHGVAAAAALGALTLGGFAVASYVGPSPSPLPTRHVTQDSHLAAPQPPAPRTSQSVQRPRSRSAASTPRSSHVVGNDSQTGQTGQTGLSEPARTPSSSARPAPRTTTTADDRTALCNAYVQAAMRGDIQGAMAARDKLAKAAGGADRINDYCAPVWTAEYGSQNGGPSWPFPWPIP
jgi:hypothetical protein